MAIYGAITAVIAAIAALRYDMTVVLPKSDDEARVIGRLATRSVITVSVMTTTLAFLLKDFIVSMWGDEELARWMPIAGLTVFFMAQVTLLQYWYNRKREYRIIAQNRVQQTIGSSGGQLAFGLAGLRTMPGLLFGVMAGHAFAFFWLNSKAKEFRKAPGPEAPTMREVAAKHKKMPILNLPNARVDAVRTHCIDMIIGTFTLGLVGNSISRGEFFRCRLDSSTAPFSRCSIANLPILNPARCKSSFAQRSVGLPCCPRFRSGLSTSSPRGYFRSFSATSGIWLEILRALTPWLALQLVTSPISTVFIVTSKQHWMLAFAIVFAAAPLNHVVSAVTRA